MAADFDAGRERRAHAGAGRSAARRDPALRRGRDRGLVRPRRHGRRPAPAARRLPRAAPAPGRLPDHLRAGRASARASTSAARDSSAAAAARRRRAARRGARPRLGARALSRARTCATSCMDRGYMVETLETAHTWSRLEELHDAVSGALDGALRRAGDPGDRHVPPLARLPRRRLAVLHLHRPRARRAPRSSSGGRSRRRPARRSSAPGGTITHHHAIGTRPRPVHAGRGRRPRAWTSCGRSRSELDPAGIMNPGKLIDPA